MDDAQTLLIVSEPTSIGSPAPIDAWRAGACPAPPCKTWPMITYSTSCGSRPIRSRAARIAIAPSSVASCCARPPPSFANGVRTAETITERGIGSSVPTGLRARFDHDVRYAYAEGTDDSRPSHLVVLALRAVREPAPGLTPSHSPFRST